MMRDLFGFGGCRGGSWKLAIVLAAVGVAGEALAGAMAYGVTILPRGRAILLNNRGDVVLDSQSETASYVWSIDGSLRALPFPERVEGSLGIEDINDSGQVVANYNETNFGPRAVVFEPDGRTRELGQTASVEPFAFFILNDGTVYGKVAFGPSFVGQRMMWPPGISEGIAYRDVELRPFNPVTPTAASNAGDMAGLSYADDEVSRIPAVIRSGVEKRLPTGDRPLGRTQAMSEDGRWIGGYLNSITDPDELAVRWRDDVLEELVRPKGAAWSVITGINNDGMAVGVSGGDTNPQGTIWDAEGVPHLVADMVQAEQAWSFEAAIAINNNGQIMGNGFAEVSPGRWEYRGFLLTPIPEPGGVVGLTLVAGWGMRRRRSSDLKSQI